MAEYMVIQDNIIEAIYCGEVESNENIIPLPENHQVQVGDNILCYNKDYTRKNNVELIKLGFMQLPQGYKLEQDNMVEMSLDEKILAGIEELPANMKMENGKLIQKSQDEIFNEMTLEQKGNFIRSKRDALINEADILLIKYQEQVELGVINADDDYRLSLLQYKENLRNVPEQAGFPENVIWSEMPIYTNKE